MNTKLLRQKILDLAIRGKLTEQKKSDGTTKDLLKQIQDERTGEALQTRDSSTCHCEAQKRRGNLKQSKSATPKEIIPLDKSEAPFEIPENWEWVRLGDIARVSTGKTPLKAEKRYYEKGTIPWITSAYTKNDGIEYSDVSITEYAVQKNTLCIYAPGTLILAMYGEGKTRGQISELRISATINQACAAIELIEKSNFHKDYIRFFQNWNYARVREGATGSTQPNLNLSIVQSMEIPLPPLAEQQRIVTAIENAFAEITEIENNQELLKKHIKQGRQKILDLAIRGKLTQQLKTDGTTKDLLAQMSFPAPTGNLVTSSSKKKGKSIEPKQIVPLDKTTAPFEIPENWEWVKLGDVLNEMQSTSPRGETFKYIDIDSIDNVACRVKSPKIIETKNAPSRASRFTKKGDVLFSMVRPYLKNIAKVIEDDCIASTGFYVCSPKGIVSDYCYYLMISNYVVDGLNQFMKGDNSPSISSKNITDWFIPLPPLAEQQRIVATIEQAFAEFDTMEIDLM